MMHPVTVAVEPGSSHQAARTARMAVWAYGGAVGMVLGWFLVGLPVQLTDSFGNMLKLNVTWAELMEAEFTQRAYLRPMLWAALKAVYDLSGGSYFAWFRGVHVVQIGLLVALYVHLVRVRSWTEAAVAPLGLAALVGSHTFAGTIREAFPINTFLTILLCCFAAAALSFSRHRWWKDCAIVVLFAFAALTVESGLLVFVIVVGAALVGARGISSWGIGGVVAACVGYFVLRFVILDVGSPGLIERSSGYGFRVLDPPELLVRFGANPLWFYAYNVSTSLVSVLFSEPRAGVFRLVWGLTHEPEPAIIVSAVASTLGTLVILWFGWTRRRAWLSRAFDHGDRLVLVFVMVLAANAAISYPYTKDVIMSPAGAFYALALHPAVSALIAGTARRGRIAGAAIAVICLMLGTTWAVRYVGAHAVLRRDAIRLRNEWAYAEQWLERQNIELTDDRSRALFTQLRNDAILRHPAPAAALESRFFEID